MTTLKVGDRVKLLQPMTNPGSTWLPVEEDMPAGLMGTITYVDLNGSPRWHQVSVRWDNGRNLGLIPTVDAFEVLPEEGAEK